MLHRNIGRYIFCSGGISGRLRSRNTDGGNTVELDVIPEVSVYGIILVDGFIIHRLGFHQIQAVIIVFAIFPEFATDNDKGGGQLICRCRTLIQIKALFRVIFVVFYNPATAVFRVFKHRCGRNLPVKGNIGSQVSKILKIFIQVLETTPLITAETITVASIIKIECVVNIVNITPVRSHRSSSGEIDDGIAIQLEFVILCSGVRDLNLGIVANEGNML